MPCERAVVDEFDILDGLFKSEIKKERSRVEGDGTRGLYGC